MALHNFFKKSELLEIVSATEYKEGETASSEAAISKAYESDTNLSHRLKAAYSAVEKGNFTAIQFLASRPELMTLIFTRDSGKIFKLIKNTPPAQRVQILTLLLTTLAEQSLPFAYEKYVGAALASAAHDKDMQLRKDWANSIKAAKKTIWGSKIYEDLRYKSFSATIQSSFDFWMKAEDVEELAHLCQRQEYRAHMVQVLSHNNNPDFVKQLLSRLPTSCYLYAISYSCQPEIILHAFNQLIIENKPNFSYTHSTQLLSQLTLKLRNSGIANENPHLQQLIRYEQIMQQKPSNLNELLYNVMTTYLATLSSEAKNEDDVTLSDTTQNTVELSSESDAIDADSPFGNTTISTQSGENHIASQEFKEGEKASTRLAAFEEAQREGYPDMPKDIHYQDDIGNIPAAPRKVDAPTSPLRQFNLMQPPANIAEEEQQLRQDKSSILCV